MHALDPNAFTRHMEAFAKIDPDMTLNQVRTFVYVAARGMASQKDLEIYLEASNATASRCVSYWTDLKKAGVEGKGFIRREEDPQDRRYKVLSLTPKGRRFAESLRA